MQKEDKKGADNNFGVASVVLGIVGAALGVLVFPIIISILGLVFGIVQFRKAKNAWAIWGIVLSILGIIISIYVIWWSVSTVSNVNQLISTCQADPTAPGCADLLKFAGVQ